MDFGERAGRFKFLIRDRDSKFTAPFDDIFSGNGTRVIRIAVRSPRAKSFAERFVGTLRRECLDHVLILGERHLRKILAEYARHYNKHRPHQGLQQKPPLHQPKRKQVRNPSVMSRAVAPDGGWYARSDGWTIVVNATAIALAHTRATPIDVSLDMPDPPAAPTSTTTNQAMSNAERWPTTTL